MMTEAACALLDDKSTASATNCFDLFIALESSSWLKVTVLKFNVS
jgi:hypothetical protein